MLLKLEELDVGYGESLICQGVDLDVAEGELVCLLGRNGVGKTTLLRAIIGLAPHARGRILFDGSDIRTRREYERARLGIGYVPQGRLVFGRLTVAENLLSGTVIGGARFGSVAEDCLEFFPILKERYRQRAGTLSGGEQQMLAISRALAGRPRLLLLDEPSEGTQPSIVQSIRDILRRIQKERNLAILLVEQNLKFASAVAARGYVMEKGHIVAAGPMQALVSDEVVQEHLTFSQEQPAGRERAG